MMNEFVRCKVCGQIVESESLREHERVMTEDKKYKNHQDFDAY
jgi:translation initiation factor 2 beta subunit (eIF-2beta)/eIF-5